jgi:hypothetical protein
VTHRATPQRAAFGVIATIGAVVGVVGLLPPVVIGIEFGLYSLLMLIPLTVLLIFAPGVALLRTADASASLRSFNRVTIALVVIAAVVIAVSLIATAAVRSAASALVLTWAVCVEALFAVALMRAPWAVWGHR